MVYKWLPIVLTIFVVSFSSKDALARDRGDKDSSAHGKAIKKSHVRGEHAKKSADASHDELEFSVEPLFSRPEFYYWPYYTFSPYSSPSTLMQSPPSAYIDQGTVTPQIQPLGPTNQDYCLNPAGYYPYVRECLSGWQRVNQPLIEQQPGYRYYCTNPAGYYSSLRECSPIWRNVGP